MSPGPTSGGIVVFNYGQWLIAYPEFSSVSPGQATEYFNRACTLFDNTACSPMQDLFTRTLTLNAATAHFAYLFAPQSDGQPRPLGRVSAATQGSVNVSLEYVTPATATEAFWNQSTYGAYAWAAWLPYRSFRYAPSLGAVAGFAGYYPGRGRGFI